MRRPARRLAPILRVASCILLLGFAVHAPAAASGTDRIARILAGLDVPAAGELPLSASRLERHRRTASHWWNDYERRIGTPLREWAAAEIPAAPGATVFYPFAGPDFPTVQRFFPDAERYVLVALQRAGPPPDIARAAADDLDTFFGHFDAAWKQFAQIGFFRTLDLEAEARRPGMRVGVTAALMAFAARLGFEVVAVEPVRVNVYGTELEGHPGDRADRATWDSVRLVLGRDARRVQLDYVRANLADTALTARPADRAWIERMAEQPTVLKAASHLLQQPAFSILREAILVRAPGVIQDETGIDYARLTEAFAVTLHGRFTRPHHLFRDDAQRALAEAYRAGVATRPLPFSMSYQREGGANLQVASRARTVDPLAGASRAPQARTLEAQIATQVVRYSQRKRKLFLTRSAAEPRHASYVDAIRGHIARLLAARGISSRGAALVSLSLAPDGTLQLAQVERHSGNAAFDRHLRDVLQGARRFPAWPDSMHKDGDLAVVTLHVPER